MLLKNSVDLKNFIDSIFGSVHLNYCLIGLDPHFIYSPHVNVASRVHYREGLSCCITHCVQRLHIIKSLLKGFVVKHYKCFPLYHSFNIFQCTLVSEATY